MIKERRIFGEIKGRVNEKGLNPKCARALYKSLFFIPTLMYGNKMVVIFNLFIKLFLPILFIKFFLILNQFPFAGPNHDRRYTLICQRYQQWRPVLRLRWVLSRTREMLREQVLQETHLHAIGVRLRWRETSCPKKENQIKILKLIL